MSGAGWDELLADAQERLREQQQGGGANAELGDEMTPQPESHVAVRWNGDGTMITKHGERGVYRVWDRDGNPGFLYQHARLVVEVDVEKPQVGDEVLILRGPTEYFEKDGEQRQVFPYVLRKRPCSDPLPGGAETAAATGGGGDDIPFMPTL